jgi:hypothetical protein
VGVDVGAAAFIRQSIIDLRNSGCAVLVISEELDELFEVLIGSPSSPRDGCHRQNRQRRPTSRRSASG